MRLVALVLVLGSLSAGCAMEAGDPSSTEEPQRHEEIVAVSGSARPITPVPGPTPTATAGGKPATVTSNQTLPSTGTNPTGGTTIEADNPNPSPWDPHSGNANGP
jgi:hypothetical protein